ncbi:unnamed protein product [Plutella xylostella]|uniref:(diamondback moth) hypothetical protein n=2 Tax=Plutella xylostella TaxID=51655 RepID=A0A8S4DW09_PLUXY|nr:unnamed protein product [Plutella xylostella]
MIDRGCSTELPAVSFLSSLLALPDALMQAPMLQPYPHQYNTVSCPDLKEHVLNIVVRVCRREGSAGARAAPAACGLAAHAAHLLAARARAERLPAYVTCLLHMLMTSMCHDIVVRVWGREGSAGARCAGACGLAAHAAHLLAARARAERLPAYVTCLLHMLMTSTCHDIVVRVWGREGSAGARCAGACGLAAHAAHLLAARARAERLPAYVTCLLHMLMMKNKSIAKVVSDTLFVLADYTDVIIELYPGLAGKIIKWICACLAQISHQSSRDTVKPLAGSLLLCLGEFASRCGPTYLTQEKEGGQSLLLIIFRPCSRTLSKQPLEPTSQHPVSKGIMTTSMQRTRRPGHTLDPHQQLGTAPLHFGRSASRAILSWSTQHSATMLHCRLIPTHRGHRHCSITPTHWGLLTALTVPTHCGLRGTGWQSRLSAALKTIALRSRWGSDVADS